ncbi:MAG: ATP-dependent DNA helicase, partial [Methanomassiliicoccales archaeon]
MELFPYDPRPNQLEFIKIVEKVAEEGRHLCLESGTGTGKTVCALSGSLQAALRTGKKVLYLTRTNSQERQVMLELRRISERHEVFGIAIQGRQVTCPLFRRDPDLKAGSPDELSRLCREKKRKVLQAQEGGCRFLKGTRLSDMEEISAHCRKNLPTAEEFVDFCDSKGICPHELMKELAREARVVAAPYAYFFIPFIRNSLIDWMDIALEDLVVVVDEAHNLPEYTREVESFQMTHWSLEAVEKEIEEYGDPEVLDGVSIRDVTGEVKRLLDMAMSEYLIDEDGLIPPSFLEEGLMEAFTMSSRGITTAAKAMMEQGEIIKERKVQESRLPRSYIHALGSFLTYWSSLEEGEYVKLVIGGDNPCFRAYCLDPVVTTSILLSCGGSIHMSGTLAPLAEYRDSIGLPYDATLATFPSPFPPENKVVMYVEDVTSKYEELSQDEDMIGRMEGHVVSICNVMDRNTVVFFPSYSMMDRFIADKALTRIKRKVHVEERGMAQADRM